MKFDLTAKLRSVPIDCTLSLAVDSLGLLLVAYIIFELILCEHIVSLEVIGLDCAFSLAKSVADGPLWVVIHYGYVRLFYLGIEAAGGVSTKGHHFVATLRNFMLGEAAFEVQRVLSLIVEKLLNYSVFQGLRHSCDTFLKSLLMLPFFTRSDAFLLEWSVEEIVFPCYLHPDARTQWASIMRLSITLLGRGQISLKFFRVYAQ